MARIALRGLFCRVQDKKQIGVQKQRSSGFDRQQFSGTFMYGRNRGREQERQQQTTRQTYRDAVVEQGRFKITEAVGLPYTYSTNACIARRGQQQQTGFIRRGLQGWWQLLRKAIYPVVPPSLFFCFMFAFHVGQHANVGAFVVRLT